MYHRVRAGVQTSLSSCLSQAGRQSSRPRPLQRRSMVLQLLTLDCYSETEAEDPDEEAGSRSASVSTVTSNSEVGAAKQDVGGSG